MYRHIVFPAIKACALGDAERAHNVGLAALRLMGTGLCAPAVRALTHVPQEPVEVFGLSFPSRLGLAAGFDKNAVAIRGLQALGFGFIEIGTVTPLPQVGNPRPRMFYLPADKGLINRMGFNNHGAAKIIARLERLRMSGAITIPIGISIGKQKDAPDDQVVYQHCELLRSAYHIGDYFVVNVSSPNTPGLRDLQKRELLEELLGRIGEARESLAESGYWYKPILVKAAPDLEDSELEAVVDVALECGMDGIIVANTTVDKSTATPCETVQEQGGMSGPLLFDPALEMLRRIKRQAPSLPVVFVGGVDAPERAVQALEEGASLVQLLTALAYEGPLLPKHINQRLARR